MTTADRIDSLFREYFGDDALTLFSSDEIFVDIGEQGKPPRLRLPGDPTPLDSLDRVEFIMAVEEEFDVEIPEGEVPTLQRRSEVVNYVDRMIGEQK